MIHIQLPIQKRPTRIGTALKTLRENLLTPHKIALMISMLLSGALYCFLPLVFALGPVYLHSLIWFWTYWKHSVKRKTDEAAWNRYVEMYGNEKGEIPVDIRLRHKRMINNGQKISLQ